MTAGPLIATEHILASSTALKLMLEHSSPLLQEQARDLIADLMDHAELRGLGCCIRNESNQAVSLRKYHRGFLTHETVKYLRANRILLSLFGPDQSCENFLDPELLCALNRKRMRNTAEQDA